MGCGGGKLDAGLALGISKCLALPAGPAVPTDAVLPWGGLLLVAGPWQDGSHQPQPIAGVTAGQGGGEAQCIPAVSEMQFVARARQKARWERLPCEGCGWVECVGAAAPEGARRWPGCRSRELWPHIKTKKRVVEQSAG